MRAYLSATLPLLTRWLAAGVAQPAGPAYALTPALRESYRDGDTDELEYAALQAAAAGSVELLAADPTAARRRMVLAVDIEDSVAVPVAGGAAAAVKLATSVPRGSWASVLADTEDAQVIVATAVANLARAAVGDEAAREALEDAAAHELGWYAIQELPQLLRGG